MISLLLTTYLLLSAAGLALWGVGHLFEYHGVASVGAVIIIMVGGVATMGVVTVPSGETVDRNYDTVNNSTVVVNETVTEQREPVQITGQYSGVISSLGLGGFTMIAGALLLAQDLSQVG